MRLLLLTVSECRGSKTHHFRDNIEFMKKLLAGLIVLSSFTVHGQNNFTKSAIDQNSTVLEEYQHFLEVQTGRKCNLEDKTFELVNVFKGSIPVAI